MGQYNKEMQDPLYFSNEFNSYKSLVGLDLHKRYGERVVLKNETVSINPGDKL